MAPRHIRFRGLYYFLSMMKTAVFIDGGHVGVLARQASHVYDPDYIEKIASRVNADETLLGGLYYDCGHTGKTKKPVSGITNLREAISG